MSSGPLGWRGFRDSDNLVIRAFGITRLFAIFALALAIDIHIGTLVDRRFALAVALGIMVADRHRIRLEDNTDLANSNDQAAVERRVDYIAIRIVILVWILFAVCPPGWLNEQLGGIATLLTVTKYVAWDRLPFAIRTIQQGLDDMEPIKLRKTWYEFKKISLRSGFGYLVFLATMVLVHLPSYEERPVAWLSAYTYVLLFSAISVAYQFFIIAAFGRSFIHLILRERVEVIGRSSSNRIRVAALRAIAVNFPLLMVTALISVDVLAFGAMPDLNDVVNVLYLLAILFYGACYFHRDRRSIHDIIAGTIVVRRASAA